jgi:hypothetical protein
MMDKPTIIKLANLARAVELDLDGLLWRNPPNGLPQAVHCRLREILEKAEEISELLSPFRDDGGTWDPPKSPLRVVK